MKRGRLNKSVNFKLKVTNKAVYTFLAVVAILVIAGIAFAYGTNAPSTFGHSAGEVEVSVNGTTYNLQQAIDQGLISGSGGVKVKTGVAKNGEVISPITGFTKSQCQVMVSANFLSHDDYTGRSDIPTYLEVSTTSGNSTSDGWTVVAKAYKTDGEHKDWICFNGINTPDSKKCGVNYMIVCGGN